MLLTRTPVGRVRTELTGSILGYNLLTVSALFLVRIVALSMRTRRLEE